VSETQPRSTAQRSVPWSGASSGIVVIQKCGRPRGSRPGTTLPS
jgi:hypothetical protein